MYWSSNPKLFWTGKDFSSFVREAAEVDRNRCDGVDEGYAALRVAPTGVTGTVRWDESDGDDTYLYVFICVYLWLICWYMFLWVPFLLWLLFLLIFMTTYLFIVMKYYHLVLYSLLFSMSFMMMIDGEE